MLVITSRAVPLPTAPVNVTFPEPVPKVKSLADVVLPKVPAKLVVEAVKVVSCS
jgi:hypothetical protein